MISALGLRPTPAVQVMVSAVQLGALLFLTMSAAAAVILFGFWALAWAGYAIGIAWAVMAPRSFALALIFTATVIEQGAFDFTEPLSIWLWLLPEAIRPLIRITLTPFDIFLLIAAVSLLVRPARLGHWPVTVPRLMWAIPLAIAFGYWVGVYYRGGPSNIAYIEARGLIMGSVVFLMALRMRDLPPQRLHLTVCWPRPRWRSSSWPATRSSCEPDRQPSPRRSSSSTTTCSTWASG